MKKYKFQIKYITLFIILASIRLTIHGADITTTVSTPTTNGQIIIELYNAVDSFRSLQSPIKKQIFPISPLNTYTLANIPEGDYAFIIYLDSNKNEILDRNSIGIPKEAIVFSNDYRPKEPPRFEKAMVSITDDSPFTVSAQLNPKKRFTALGGGFIFMGQSSPYEGTEYSIRRFFPVITYIGEKVQWFGPFLNISLMTYKNTSISGTFMARFGAYEENESPLLNGLGDRKTALMGGFSTRTKLPLNITLKNTFRHDLTHIHNGSTFSSSLVKTILYKSFMTTLDVELEWLSSDIANYEFGVPTSKATGHRPGYTLDSIVTITPSLSTRFPISKKWMSFNTCSLQYLSTQVTHSPIVNQNILLRYMMGLSYQF